MVKDLDIQQGSTFEFLGLIKDVNGLPLDMTLYTGGTAGVRAKIRRRASDAVAAATFTVSVLNSTGVSDAAANGACHLTTTELAALEPLASGKCYALLRLSAADTAALARGCYELWDCEIEDTTGFVFKPFTGAVQVRPEATK